MDTTIEVSFSRKKETPNAVQFQEIVAPGRQRGVCGSIYVLKSDLETLGNPDKITITIMRG